MSYRRRNVSRSKTTEKRFYLYISYTSGSQSRRLSCLVQNLLPVDRGKWIWYYDSTIKTTNRKTINGMRHYGRRSCAPGFNVYLLRGFICIWLWRCVQNRHSTRGILNHTAFKRVVSLPQPEIYCFHVSRNVNIDFNSKLIYYLFCLNYFLHRGVLATTPVYLFEYNVM